MRTIKLSIAATETRPVRRFCGASDARRDGRCGYWYERLPECIAAEAAEKEDK